MPELAIDTTTDPCPLVTTSFFSHVADLLAFRQRHCSIRSCRRRHNCRHLIRGDDSLPACLDYAGEKEVEALAAISDQYVRLTEALLFGRLPSPVDLPNDPITCETFLMAAEILARTLPPEVDAKTFHQWRKACLQAELVDLRLQQ